MKIKINPLLKTKLDYIVNNFNYEIGGYLVGEVKDEVIHLKEILIPKQIVSGVHVDISPQSQIDLRQRYGDKVFKIIGHFHSHHTMGAFWSGTDINNMTNIMKGKKWYVFIVGSTTGYLTRLSIRDPVPIDIDRVDLELNSLDFTLFKKILEKNVVVGDRNFNKIKDDEYEEPKDDYEIEDEVLEND